LTIAPRFYRFELRRKDIRLALAAFLEMKIR
jgi:hypothetical protein